MNIATAERAHERAQIACYADLIDSAGRRMKAEDAALRDYLDDAYTGRDPDWASSDPDMNADVLLQISALLSTDEHHACKIADIRSLIHALQIAAAVAHVEALKRNKRL